MSFRESLSPPLQGFPWTTVQDSGAWAAAPDPHAKRTPCLGKSEWEGAPGTPAPNSPIGQRWTLRLERGQTLQKPPQQSQETCTPWPRALHHPVASRVRSPHSEGGCPGLALPFPAPAPVPLPQSALWVSQAPHMAIPQGGGQAGFQGQLSTCCVSVRSRVPCKVFSPHRNLTTRVLSCPYCREEAGTSKWCNDLPTVTQLIIGRERIGTKAVPPSTALSLSET